MSQNNKTLIVQSDWSRFLEVHHDDYEAARDAIIFFQSSSSLQNIKSGTRQTALKRRRLILYVNYPL